MFSYSLPHACALVARLEDKRSDEIEIAGQGRCISYRDYHMSAGGLYGNASCKKGTSMSPKTTYDGFPAEMFFSGGRFGMLGR